MSKKKQTTKKKAKLAPKKRVSIWLTDIERAAYTRAAEWYCRNGHHEFRSEVRRADLLGAYFDGYMQAKKDTEVRK